ncbi:MAG: toll/interleukin-1 receptor domain-containing protein [Synergistaceae bacterium]|jgi:hypothetical protein|nr:toll/interleukin-1 receptor domain-containing protein [Synergistaceae bacterium]
MSGKRAACKVVPCDLRDESFVFISYAHLDSDVVFPIIEGIGAKGYAIWYDKGINISSTWTDEIANAIMNCSIFIIFITKESAESMYVRSEIEFALNNKIKIIPVYLDGMDVLPPGLALGLNATQGIVDVSSPESIVNQICDTLTSNNVVKKGEAHDTNIKYKKYKNNLSAKFFRIAVIALAVTAILYFKFGADPGSKQADYSFKIDKASYMPAEPIFVNLSAVTQKMIEEGAIVGVAHTGDKQGEYISSEFIGNDKTRIKLRAPLERGEYEVRGYKSGNVLTEHTLVGASPFTVEGAASGEFSVAIDRREYAPSENIKVNVAGVPKYMLDDNAVVSLCRSDAKPDEFIACAVIGTRDQEFIFYAPSSAGEYEIRGYSNNDVFAAPTIVAAEKFNVLEEEDVSFAVEMDKPVYAPNEPITVKATGVHCNIGGGAIVAISKVGGGPGDYISYERINDSDTVIAMRAPLESGEYEIRGYRDWNVLTESGIAARIPFKVEGLADTERSDDIIEESYQPQ